MYSRLIKPFHCSVIAAIALLTATVCPLVSAPPSPVTDEFRELLQSDETALQQVDQLIANNEAFTKQGAGLPESTMIVKIRSLADPVMAAYESFLARHPQHVRGHLAFASFLSEFGVTVRARSHLDKALALAPDDPVTLNNVANYHGEHGPPEKAFELLERAMRLKPEESTYYRNTAGIILLHRKEAQQHFRLADEPAVFRYVLDLYQKAHTRKPDDFLLASDLAQTHYQLDPFPYKDAVAAWEKAFALAPSRIEKEGVMIHLARIHTQAANYDEARRNLNSITVPKLLPTKRRLLAGLPSKMKAVNFSAPKKSPSLFNLTTAPPKGTGELKLKK